MVAYWPLSGGNPDLACNQMRLCPQMGCGLYEMWVLFLVLDHMANFQWWIMCIEAEEQPVFNTGCRGANPS